MVDPNRLIFIDEAGSHVSMHRQHARGPCGQRAPSDVPRNRGNPITIIGAVALEGMGPVMTIEGGTSGDVFAAYVEHFLAPTLRPGDLVVRDNLGADKDARIPP